MARPVDPSRRHRARLRRPGPARGGGDRDRGPRAAGDDLARDDGRRVASAPVGRRASGSIDRGRRGVTGLTHALTAMSGRRVLVLGEAMLDSYLHGRADRLSREAPVPVVSLDERVDAAGGAANSAVNLGALGAEVRLLSVVGSDDEASRLRTALVAGGIDDSDLIVAPGRRTLAKQRVLGGGQILVRFDSGSTESIDAEIEDDLIRRIEAAVPQVDAVLLSDYAYGILGPRIDAALRTAVAGREVVVVVDARDPARHAALRPTATKPNYGEA